MKHLDTLRTAAHISDFHYHDGTNANWQNTIIPEDLVQLASGEISSWNGYAPTPLLNLPFANDLGVAKLSYKDESGRFGLGSFKALGGAFAVMKLVAEQLNVPMAEIRAGKHAEQAAKIHITTATDGNHGRSVAWGCQLAGCPCFIYIHAEVSQGRADAMAVYGAEIVRVDGDYDASVRTCAADAEEHERFVVSDTSYEGYIEVPRAVMAGYGLMASEVVEQTSEPFTHVIFQAGVGGMAAGFMSGMMVALNGKPAPKFIIVESDMAPCIIKSIRADEPLGVTVTEETIMAGLSCGEPSPLSFDVMRAFAEIYMTIHDKGIATCMRLLAENGIEGGECGATGVVALAALMKDQPKAIQAGLNENSHVLVIGTEGATDAQIYKDLLESDQV